MTRPSRANRRDKNEPPIVEYLQRAGCEVIQMQPGQGCDLIVIAQNGVHVVEVKNPDYKWELTAAESMMKLRIEQNGQRYNVIETIEDAARMINREVWDESERVGR
jgi:hypothetical protein